MQSFLDKPQPSPQKVKNILIRHSCSKRVEVNCHYQHPETPYILKYAPKYYKDLTLQTACQSPLLSKVKKIKKLQKFTGYFGRRLPRQLWFNLLGNNRKEIEEAPQISSTNTRVKPNKAFWEKLNQQKLRFFWNLTKIWLQQKDENDMDNFLSCKKAFMKHIWNLRKLKTLKIMVKDDNYDKVKWVLSKLDGMNELLKRLETLGLDVNLYNKSVQDLFKNKKLFSHLTGMNLSGKLDPILAEVPLICKNLNSLVLNFGYGADGKPEFRNLLTSIQQLTQLKCLEFNWPIGEKNFWSHFKPPSSLERLRLRLHVGSLADEGGVVAHWEEIKEMRTLELPIACDRPEQFNLVKMFITRVLKKVQKLEILKVQIVAPFGEENGERKTYEPFFIEDVSHLHESLRIFDYRFYSWTEDRFGKFDLKTLMPFRNLKALKLDAHMEFYENIEEIVSLLEGNEDSVLEFNLKTNFDLPQAADWLSENLKILEKRKKRLKVRIDLTLGLKDSIEILETLCNAIQSVQTIRGLKLCLRFVDGYDYNPLPTQRLKELLGRYPGIRNLNVLLSNRFASVERIKVDGEKEQFIEKTKH